MLLGAPREIGLTPAGSCRSGRSKAEPGNYWPGRLSGRRKRRDGSLRHQRHKNITASAHKYRTCSAQIRMHRHFWAPQSLWVAIHRQTRRRVADQPGHAAANVASSGDPPLTICTVRTSQHAQKRRHPHGQCVRVAPAGRPFPPPSDAQRG